jgi:hypothetical protein
MSFKQNMSFVASPDSERPYFPMLLANGRDAVLIDYSGSMMTGEPDHTHHELNQGTVKGWYKVAHRATRGEPILPVAQSGYHMVCNGERYEPDHFRQSFDPATAILTTTISATGFEYVVETFVTDESVLVEHFEVRRVPRGKTGLEFFVAAPGAGLYPTILPEKVGVKLEAVTATGAVEYTYRIRNLTGHGFLWSDRATTRGADPSLHITGLKSGDKMTKFVMMLDETDGGSTKACAGRRFKKLAARAYRQLRAEHVKGWKKFSGKSSVQIPDQDLQYLYDLSLYVSKAHQHPTTGAATVGMFPPLWGGGGVFGYDCYYLQQAWLRTNHTEESEKLIGFWKRCSKHARKFAREIEMPGLFYPAWNFTPNGDDYGRNLEGLLREKRLENCVVALEILRHYESTGDAAELARNWTTVRGCIDFLLAESLVESDHEATIKEAQGVSESLAVPNDTLTAVVLINALALITSAAASIGKNLPARYGAILQKLRAGITGNYRDGVLMASRGATEPGCIPLTAAVFSTPESVDFRSVNAALRQTKTPWGLGGGFPTESYQDWPWFHFRAAIALAYLDHPKAASYVFSGTRCNSALGAFPEKIRIDGYAIGYWYSSPHALYSIAITTLLLNDAGGTLNVFPLIPATWKDVAFRDLRLPPGLRVSATMKEGKVREVVIKNDSGKLVETRVRIPSRFLASRSRKKEILFPLRLLPGRKKVVIRS